MIDGPARRRLATTAVLGAMALVVLDAGMTNVALPTIGKFFGIAPATSILVASSYQLALVMGLLPAAHIAERLGERSLFIVGIILFTLASALAASAPEFTVMVAARFLQGIGGAAILALGMSLLRSTIGTGRLGSAIAWNALNVAICAAAGPSLGALVLTFANWRWLYLVTLPLAVFTVVTSFALPRAIRSTASIDWSSIALYFVCVASIFLALDIGGRRFALACTLAGVAAIAAAFLIRRERLKASPLIPFDLLSHRPFRYAVGASVSCFVAQSAGLVALTFHLQFELSLDILSTGAVLAGWPLAVALTSPLASRLAGRADANSLCVAGAVILALGLFSASFVPGKAGAAPIAFCAMICGVGFGLFQVPNNRNLFLSAPLARSGAAGGAQGTARLTGQTLGALLVAIVFTSIPDIAAPPLALAMAGSFALVAALVSAWRATTEGTSDRELSVGCEVSAA